MNQTMKLCAQPYKFGLDSKPTYNWLYDINRTSDILVLGATCLQAAPGTDVNHKNGENP